uniref:Cholinergic receptor nicotinic gamma subunit n=1 Tax=Anser brachyrhynchus TaxID=132585 RepID=A0A8B9BPS1_9AVES
MHSEGTKCFSGGEIYFFITGPSCDLDWEKSIAPTDGGGKQRALIKRHARLPPRLPGGRALGGTPSPTRNSSWEPLSPRDPWCPVGSPSPSFQRYFGAPLGAHRPPLPPHCGPSTSPHVVPSPPLPPTHAGCWQCPQRDTRTHVVTSLRGRERRVGHQAPPRTENHQFGALHPGRHPVPAGGLLPHHPAQAPLLHHQHHRALRPHLLHGRARLLSARQRYLTFLMVVTVVIVVNAVIVLNVSLRTPNTHSMSQRVRQVCLHLLPRYLGMHMPEEAPGPPRASRRRSSLGLMVKADEYMLWKARTELLFEKQKERDGLMKTVLEKIGRGLDSGYAQDFCQSLEEAGPEIRACVDACNHIANATREQNDFNSENEEWILVGRVIDRVCFFIMASLFVCGTVGIFLMAHFNQAPALPFPGDPKLYLPQ